LSTQDGGYRSWVTPASGTVECSAETQFPVSLVRVTGRLDLPGADWLRGFLLNCLAQQPAVLVLDLSGLAVTDDRALAVLPAMGRRAADWPGAELLLCASDPQLVAALDRTGVTRQLPWYRDRQAALAVATRRPTAHRFAEGLPASVAAARQARELLTRAGAEWRLPLDLVQVAQVIATELVSNAVLHAHPPFNFSTVLRENRLHVAAGDGDPNPPRRQTGVTDRDDHGRGLQLVGGLATGWGCLSTPDGKVVWATLRVPPG
jgi:anti-sigma regulatory factor (Ser/Thr protein kinase)/anti-anti-sigma regulatory factor